MIAGCLFVLLSLKDLAMYINEVKRDNETLKKISEFQSSIENLVSVHDVVVWHTGPKNIVPWYLAWVRFLRNALTNKMYCLNAL